MSDNKESNRFCCYASYLVFSVVAFSILTVIHSWLTYDQINLLSFIVPIFAGLIVGSLMAHNKVLRMELTQLANTDKLTGAYNRTYFDKRLEVELDRAKRYDLKLSLLYVDLDHFKRVNDTHGHKIGDSVLVDFAAVTKGTIRDSDIFARFGGEEFIILAQMADKDSALILYNRVKTAIDEHNFEVIGSITFSAGIAELDSKNDTIESLLDRADKALYTAKETGRNQAIVADQTQIESPGEKVFP